MFAGHLDCRQHTQFKFFFIDRHFLPIFENDISTKINTDLSAVRHLANLGGNTRHVVAQMPFLRLVNPGGQSWDAQSTCDCHGTGPLLIPQCCGCLLLLWLSYLFSLGVAPSPFHPQPIKLQQESSFTSHSSGLSPLNTRWMNLEPFLKKKKILLKSTWVIVSAQITFFLWKQLRLNIYFHAQLGVTHLFFLIWLCDGT